MDPKNIVNQIKSEFSVNIFLNKLFTLRQVAVLYHLNISGEGSYSKHKASNSLYENLSDKIDGFIESYQGKYGIIKNLTVDKAVLDKDFLQYLIEITKYTESCQSKFKETWLQNQVDEITTILYTSIYKLKNLS